MREWPKHVRSCYQLMWLIKDSGVKWHNISRLQGRKQNAAALILCKHRFIDFDGTRLISTIWELSSNKLHSPH